MPDSGKKIFMPDTASLRKKNIYAGFWKKNIYAGHSIVTEKKYLCRILEKKYLCPPLFSKIVSSFLIFFILVIIWKSVLSV